MSEAGGRIRNFAIIAHIDHGKSTLADRLMEKTGLLPPAQTKVPRIDRMALEIERGVTIKLKAVRLTYHPQILNSNLEARNKFKIINPNDPNSLEFRNSDFEFPYSEYILNMVDTPGHADFSYEVSRSLAACEGVLLLVDATQGVQAQTLSHYGKARELGLTVIGVINKIDSPLAKVEETEKEIRILGIEGEILRISALRGEGIEKILQVIVERVPSPKGSVADPFRALIFDSSDDEHLGTIAYVRVFDGKIEKGDKQQARRVRFLGTNVETSVRELGFFTPDRKAAESLSAGEVGYLATGLRDPQAVLVGDTVTLINQLTNQPINPLPGYQPPQSFVFASFFAQNIEFQEFKRALETLRLEEPAMSLEEISSTAFGRGFKIGFLGTFHLEIVRERLIREFGLELVVTKPTVSFRALEEEPWIHLAILTPPEYVSAVTRSIVIKRGIVQGTESFGDRLKISAELPFLEFIRGFYDSLKSISRGYASLSWEFLGYRLADLVELQVLVHGESVEGLTEIVPRSEAEKLGREKLKKLKEILPQQQFAYSIQAAIGAKIIAREDVPAFKKDVLAKLSGGHVERKIKKLQEQKIGKARLAKHGRVEIPPEAFLV